MTTINTSVGSRSYEDFLIPGYEVLTDYFTLASGQNVVKYEVLAKNSAGKLVSYDAEAAAPQNVAYTIALEDSDATGGDLRIPAYVKGVFKKSKVVFGNTGDYEDNAYDDLRDRGIFLHGPSA